MMTVGIRELKNRLSEYIRLVRAGEIVRVTDRGTVVAELAPPVHPGGARDMPPGLRELAGLQEVAVGLPNDPDLYAIGERPLLRGISSRELLDEERGER